MPAHGWFHPDDALAREDFAPAVLDRIDARAKEHGRYLFEHLPESRPNIFQRRWWDDRIMDWAMRDEALKVQLFRFVDVLPMLQTSEQVTEHLREYLGSASDHVPYALKVALGVARRTPVTRHAVARVARLSAMDFARRFIAGTDRDEVTAAVERERQQGRGFTLDILGEAVTSDAEAAGYHRQYLDLIENLAPAVNRWPDDPRVDQAAGEAVPRFNLSIKLSALDSQFDAVDFEGTTRRVAVRLRELLRAARRQHGFINVDMESYDTKSLTLHIFKTVLDEDEFRDVTDVGIVIQAYLRDSAQDLAELRDWARRRGSPVWVRLVKGAYWDYETAHAQAMGWPIPVYQEKWLSDANFERLARFLIRNHRHLRPAIGSHNIRSIAYAMAVADQLEIDPRRLEVQMLYGMADPEKQAIVDLGYPMRIYMPYGQLIPGMAYLVRRLLENTSNDSFLRAGFMENVSPEWLLENPVEHHGTSPESAETNGDGEEVTANEDASNSEDQNMPETNAAADPYARFENEPPVDFAREENRRAMHEALDQVAERLGLEYQPVIGGRKTPTGDIVVSVNPADREQHVGLIHYAHREEAQDAVGAAKEAFTEWSATEISERADFLRRAAQVMRRRFFELCAWEVYECGKPWREATGDVCEAIDFCEYYALGGLDLWAGGGRDVPGEENRFVYCPRGVAAVIAPWNFPLAILTGMTAAALVTGNTVVMKPAEQSPVVASLLMEIFDEIGLPPGVASYLPGRGEVAGAALVEHPDVALIAFTGSRQVGLSIYAQAAANSQSGVTQVKKVIAEMGGKNAIIVDDDADLDEAVLGVVKSAFGYQGQKCSACSRAVVLESVYDAFVARLVEATRSLQVGPATDPATTIGPVIDEEAFRRIHDYVEIGRSEGREIVAVDAGDLADRGNFIGPHVFADVSPDARIAQEEIFGPVLAVIRAADLDEAIAIVNGTDYALTGGIFSRSPAHLERAARELAVGNLYLNRGITGALVSRQPFGGFRMSGIGTKAGGRDYLLQFVLPKTITENTMRRGFAPTAEAE